MGDEAPSCGFAAVSHVGIRTLVLGSLPGRRSIETNQYYGHPRNAFWPLMATLLGFDTGMPYAQRTAALLDADIGLWDVLQSSIRPGSLDADIDLSSARANDFSRFMELHPALIRICFNGKKAGQLFRRMGCLQETEARRQLTYVELPSTSPAHAAMSFADKLSRWAIVTEPDEPVR